MFRDLTSNQSPTAPLRTRGAALALGVAGLILMCAGACLGIVGITGPADRSLPHSTSDTAQIFSESVWNLRSEEIRGSTVLLESGPFVHATQSSLKADCKLDLRVASSVALAFWRATIPTSQTNIATGVERASVSARSFGVGNGSVGVTVTFQNTDFSTLGAGNYTATIIGTITGN